MDSDEDEEDEVLMMSENKEDEASCSNLLNKPTLTEDFVVENF